MDTLDSGETNTEDCLTCFVQLCRQLSRPGPPADITDVVRKLSLHQPELIETGEDGVEKKLQQQHDWAQGLELMLTVLADESKVVQVSASRDVSGCRAPLSNYVYNTSFGRSQLVVAEAVIATLVCLCSSKLLLAGGPQADL